MKQLGLGVAVLVLALMAGLQLNDPDPAYWVATYLAAAAVPLLRMLGHYPAWLTPAAMGMVLAGLLLSASGFFDYLTSGDYGALLGGMSTAKPYVESAREFIGLLIAGVLLWTAGRQRH